MDEVARLAELKASVGHSLRIRLSADAAWVKGNRVQLEKVLANLINNGLEAMAEGLPGTLDVRLRLERDGKRVRVSVCDRGPGIAKENLGRVFEPFFTTKPTGLGMGLAICKSLITAHQGSLWVRSSPRCGSVFHVVLPLVAPGAEVVIHPDDRGPRLRAPD